MVFLRRSILVALAASITHVAASITNLGTLNASTLPKFLYDSGYPSWVNSSAANTNPDVTPSTGVTRYFNFTASRAVLAPDGVDRPVILVNGQFPGPAIEANWGDTIHVTVTNQITGPDEGFAIHWHGIRQNGTPWMDGVPSASQCPIAPGASFTYVFTADVWGTSFWHSHFGAQYSAGAFGPMIIYGPQSTPYDVDIGPVFLSDWYHANYLEIVEEIVGLPAPKTQSYSDNNMINGRMPFDCSNANVTLHNLTCTSNSEYSKFRFTKGKTHLLRLMNVGSQGMQRFTLDGMKMTVIANDLVPIIPYETDVVTLGIGQRADVIVNATGESTDSLWMRSDVSAYCATSTQCYAKAAIYYEDADTTVLPTTNATAYDDSFCGNTPLNYTTPLYAMNPPAVPGTVQQLDIKFAANASGNTLWWVNNQTFRADYEHPILLLSKAGNTSYPNPDWITYNIGSNASARIIIYNYSQTPRSQHPMHFHGHNYWIVAEGVGEWDGTANLVNPMRRDTHILQPGDPNIGPAYMVMDFVADNPGVWPLHCHLAWHVSAGLYVNILENPDKIASLDIPHDSYETCRDWTSYKGVDMVPEIDSGV